MNIENIDLVYIVSQNLKDSIGENVANIFLNDEIVDSAKGKSTTFQRVMLNRYFYNLLLTYRAYVNNPVHNATYMLVNDGETEDWIKLFNIFVLPFIKDNYVFKVVYDC